MSRYGKFIAQVFFAAVTVLVAALQDDRVDAAEWINVLLALFGAVSVLGAGEFTEGVWRHTKTIIAGITAGLMLAVSYVSDGWYITTSEWLQIALAVGGALGVAFVPGPKVYDAAALGRAASGLKQGPK